MTKPAFYRVGNRIVNRYEVREVSILKPSDITGYPRASITYKDGSRVIVKGTRVPMFINWMLEENDKPFGY